MNEITMLFFKEALQYI